jgi:hypothetical protein
MNDEASRIRGESGIIGQFFSLAEGLIGRAKPRNEDRVL